MTLCYAPAQAATLGVEVEIWDYEDHPGDCCALVIDGARTVCCRDCAGTGVWPVPWIRNVTEGRADPDAACVLCKATGRSVVMVA